MKRLLALVVALLMFSPVAASAGQSEIRQLWSKRILLRLEGGECEANGIVAPTYELYIVPRVMRVNNKWVPIENTTVRILIDDGGSVCV